MKAIRNALLAMVVVLSCALISCTDRQEGHYTYYTNPVVGPVSIYQAKDQDAPVIAEVYKRQQVEMLSLEGSWARIVVGSDTGYVVSSNLNYDFTPYTEDEIEEIKSSAEAESDIAEGANLLGVPWYAWLALIALPLLFPKARLAYRWIIFVPVALVGVFVYSVIWPIFGFYTISGWVNGIILAIIGYALPWWLLIIVDIANLLLQFYLLMLIGHKLCPNPSVGARVCGVVGLLLVLFNTWDCGNVAMFSFATNEENINWIQTVVLLVVAMGCAIYPFTARIDD